MNASHNSQIAYSVSLKLSTRREFGTAIFGRPIYYGMRRLAALCWSILSEQCYGTIIHLLQPLSALSLQIREKRALSPEEKLLSRSLLSPSLALEVSITRKTIQRHKQFLSSNQDKRTRPAQTYKWLTSLAVRE